MKKVLVHLHLFYHEQLPYFIGKLRNIVNCDWDLFVTVCEHNSQSEKSILKLKKDAKIILVKNIGYDILPFLTVLKSVNLDDYDFVLKLHTKSARNEIINLNGIPFYGIFWQQRLVNSLLSSKEIFNNNLTVLCREDYGMVADSFFTIKLLNYPEDTYILDELKKQLNIKSNFNYFLAGSMFFMKTSILKRLTKLNISDSLDKATSTTGSIGSMFHAIERIFTILTVEEGFKIYTVPMF